MGLRATVIKTYKVEYGNANGFNYDPGTLANIIGSFCSDMFLGGDQWNEGYSTDGYWEISKSEFEEMLAELREMSAKEFKERMEDEWFDGSFSDEKPYTKKYVLDVLEGFLEETPEDENYVRFGWL